MSDSKKKSCVEVFSGKIVSFIIGYFINMLVLPLFGIAQNEHAIFLTISAIFVGIATIRSYIWRRLFNYLGEGFLK